MRALLISVSLLFLLRRVSDGDVQAGLCLAMHLLSCIEASGSLNSGGAPRPTLGSANAAGSIFHCFLAFLQPTRAFGPKELGGTLFGSTKEVRVFGTHVRAWFRRGPSRVSPRM